MLTNIECVVFDLGGVVIDLCRERCIEALARLGYSRADEELGLYVQKGPFYQLETGKITAAEFYDDVKKHCVPGTTDTDIQDAFNAFLVDLPVERLRALRSLRGRYRTIGLPNTNPVMYDSWIRHAFTAEGLAIDDYFDGVVKSFAEGVCKPDPEIFRILLRRYCLDPRRTLYLDDSPGNCAEAEKLGIATELVTAENDMLAIISKLP